MTKVTDWTEQSAQNVAASYKDGVSVAALAKQVGRSEASVRAKLVSLGVYVKAAATGKTSAAAAGKAELASAISLSLLGTKDGLTSLASANKKDLETLWGALVKLSDKAETK